VSQAQTLSLQTHPNAILTPVISCWESAIND
jgi:hypothetical protein